MMAQRDAFLESAERHLGGDAPLATWSAPRDGMFAWLELVGVDDASALVRERCVAETGLLLP